MLSNFYYSPFIHPLDGQFDSVEGYWFYLKIKLEHGIERDQYRKLSGKEAKKHGSKEKITLSPKHKDEFKKRVKMALRAKIEQNEDLLKMFKKSTLPFEHYYEYGDRITELPQYKWICDYLNNLRMELSLAY